MRYFWALLKRDIRCIAQSSGEAIAAILFFALPPLFIGFSMESGGIHLRLALSVVLLIALLSMIAGLQRIWRDDAECGYLDQLRINPSALSAAVWAKIAASTAALSIPIIAIAPWMIGILQSDIASVTALYNIMPVLILLAIAISLLSVMMAALALPAGQSPALLYVWLLPLSAPLFIFALAASEALIAGNDWYPPLVGILAYTMVAAVICPAATAQILKNMDG